MPGIVRMSAFLTDDRKQTPGIHLLLYKNMPEYPSALLGG